MTDYPLRYFLKVRPWWLGFIPQGYWVTLRPNIYYPATVPDPTAYPNVIAHECVHIWQQNQGNFLWWLVRYVCVPSFRLKMEAAAYAAEADACAKWGDHALANTTVEQAAAALASWKYLWAASSESEAFVMITELRKP